MYVVKPIDTPRNRYPNMPQNMWSLGTACTVVAETKHLLLEAGYIYGATERFKKHVETVLHKLKEKYEHVVK